MAVAVGVPLIQRSAASVPKMRGKRATTVITSSSWLKVETRRIPSATTVDN